MCLSTPKTAFQSAPAVSRHTMPKRSNRRSTSASALVCGRAPTRDQRPASMTRTRRRTVFFTFPDSVASISRTGRKLSARTSPRASSDFSASPALTGRRLAKLAPRAVSVCRISRSMSVRSSGSGSYSPSSSGESKRTRTRSLEAAREARARSPGAVRPSRKPLSGCAEPL